MKQSLLLSTLFAVLFFISCGVKSLYPLSDKKQDMVFKKELLGEWKETKNNTQYFIDTVNGSLGKEYAVMLIDHSSNDKLVDTSRFLAILVNLKGHYFIDCMTDISQHVNTTIGELSKSLLLSTHFFIKVYTIDKNVITMSVIDKDALSLLLKDNKIRMKHENINKDDILLLDNSEVLQQKLIELEKFSSVYKKDSLVRIK